MFHNQIYNNFTHFIKKNFSKICDLFPFDWEYIFILGCTNMSVLSARNWSRFVVGSFLSPLFEVVWMFLLKFYKICLFFRDWKSKSLRLRTKHNLIAETKLPIFSSPQMSILTPAPPIYNAARNVNSLTKPVIFEELERGLCAIFKIFFRKMGFKPWFREFYFLQLS